MGTAQPLAGNAVGITDKDFNNFATGKHKSSMALDNLEQLARYDFLDLCLLGETGTGKTHTARVIHELSPRSSRPFVSVNCAELSPTIIEAELFGHEKGAFTGAVGAKEGKFEAANGGTLFLDEIGELSGPLQAKLLKIVEEKSVTRVGGNRPRPLDLRIVYATHRNLDVFREDIRYRITSHAVYLRPLRERRDEIVPLAQAFIANFNAKSGKNVTAEIAVLTLLEHAPWRGNVRELRSFTEKVCLDALFETDKNPGSDRTVCITREIVEYRLARHITYEGGSPISPSGSPPPFVLGDRLEEYLERIEAELLRAALENHKHNQTRAARELGISRSGLIKKMKRFVH